MMVEQACAIDQQDVELRLVVKHTFFHVESVTQASHNPRGCTGHRIRERALSDTEIEYDYPATNPPWIGIQQVQKAGLLDGETESIGTTADGSCMESLTVGSASPVESPRGYKSEDEFSRGGHIDGIDSEMVETSSMATGQDHIADNLLQAPQDDSWCVLYSSPIEFIPIDVGSMGLPWVPACSGDFSLSCTGREPSYALPTNLDNSSAHPESCATLRDMAAAQLEAPARQAKGSAQQARSIGHQPQDLLGQVSPTVGSWELGLVPRTDISHDWNSLALTTPSLPHQALAAPISCKVAAAPPCIMGLDSNIRGGSDGVRTPQNSSERTTIMLRNLPNDYTREMLRELLDSEGFTDRYDFIYLPVDFRRLTGLGYAFVNLVSRECAENAMERFQGFKKWKGWSMKVCDVSWSCPLQGLAANIERYRNSSVMHPDVPDECKPVILALGTRCEFPPPTKRIRWPRMKLHASSGVSATR